jgi:membrane protein YqaA with SNARE-associated domain
VIVDRLKSSYRQLETSVGRPWFRPLMALIALVDHFVLVFPVDAFLLSTTFLQPKKWFSTAAWFWLGSCAGIFIFYFLVFSYGMSFVDWVAPGISSGSIWNAISEFFQNYGLWVLFISAVSSIPQQPATAILSLAAVPFDKFAAVYLLGRAIKYVGLCYLASHAPNLLKKFWRPPKPPIQE